MLECIGEIPDVKEVVLLNIIDADDSALEKHGWNYDSLIAAAKVSMDEQIKHIDSVGPKVRPVLKMIEREMSGVDGVDLQRPKPRPDVELIDGYDIMRNNFAAAGRKATVHILEGNPSKEIISIAKKRDASMIMMSYQGKGMLEHFRVGSTTFDVAHKADRPVMVIKPPKVPAKG